MHFSDHDVSQFNEPYVRSLSPDQHLAFTLKLLSDHKETRDRVNQTPQNSSIPSGSQQPWASGSGTSETDDEDGEDCEEAQTPQDDAEKKSGASEDDSDTEGASEPVADGNPPETPPNQNQSEKDKGKGKRKPGKQEGAPGHGRKVTLPLTGGDIIHKASHCAGCGVELGEDAVFEKRTGLYVIDLAMNLAGILGLILTHIKHIYGDTECPCCGHTTRTEPGRCDPEAGWKVALTEWHLVGPMLLSFIVFLKIRMHMSCRRIQEMLNDWLGVWLSIGTINQCIHEAGRAMEPLEKEMIEDIRSAELAHGDETSWKEHGKALWFWAFCTVTVTLFLIGDRSRKMIEKVLGEIFSGWLMSDGWKVYRKYPKRLRCWAHLIRKARGLAESTDSEARKFGKRALAILKKLQKEIYRVREGQPPGAVGLRRLHAIRLGLFKKFCEQHKFSPHEKTRALAKEFLNDWEAIWAVLSHPHLPLTNNEAERALRHSVISRRISYGTRTPQGSRAFALLASVIETCRKRGEKPWPYMAEVIAVRRTGRDPPPLPAAANDAESSPLTAAA